MAEVKVQSYCKETYCVKVIIVEEVKYARSKIKIIKSDGSEVATIENFIRIILSTGYYEQRVIKGRLGLKSW